MNLPARFLLLLSFFLYGLAAFVDGGTSAWGQADEVGYTDISTPIANNKCCTPAYGTNPAPPLGAVSECTIDPTNPKACVNKPLRPPIPSACQGDAFQAIKNGKCYDQDKAKCDDQGVNNIVYANKGTWTCLTGANKGPDASGQCCVWVESFPIINERYVVPGCTGDGCNAPGLN